MNSNADLDSVDKLVRAGAFAPVCSDLTRELRTLREQVTRYREALEKLSDHEQIAAEALNPNSKSGAV